MTAPANRLPIEPALHAIAAMTGRTVHPTGLWGTCPQCEHGGCVTLTDLARAAHVSKRTVERWKAAGGIPEPADDRIACELGLHLDIIWPQQVAA